MTTLRKRGEERAGVAPDRAGTKRGGGRAAGPSPLALRLVSSVKEGENRGGAMGLGEKEGEERGRGKSGGREGNFGVRGRERERGAWWPEGGDVPAQIWADLPRTGGEGQ